MIINATSVSVTLYTEADVTLDQESKKLILKENAEPWMVLPPAGKTLNAVIVSEPTGKEIEGIPIEKQKVTTLDDPFEVFPDATPNDYFVVPNICRDAAKEIGASFADRLLGIGARVYRDTKSAPAGALRLLQ